MLRVFESCERPSPREPLSRERERATGEGWDATEIAGESSEGEQGFLFIDIPEQPISQKVYFLRGEILSVVSCRVSCRTAKAHDDDDDGIKFDDGAANSAETSQKSVKCIKLLLSRICFPLPLDVKIF